MYSKHMLDCYLVQTELDVERVRVGGIVCAYSAGLGETFREMAWEAWYGGCPGNHPHVNRIGKSAPMRTGVVVPTALHPTSPLPSIFLILIFFPGSADLAEREKQFVCRVFSVRCLSIPPYRSRTATNNTSPSGNKNNIETKRSPRLVSLPP